MNTKKTEAKTEATEAGRAQCETLAQRMGRKVAQIRESMHLTQAQFARRIGMGDRWKKLSAYETGRVRVPTKWLERIAEVSGYSITYFLEIEVAGLSSDERKLLAVYRAIRDPRLKDTAIELVLDGLKADERLRGEDEEEGDDEGQ